MTSKQKKIRFNRGNRPIKTKHNYIYIYIYIYSVNSILVILDTQLVSKFQIFSSIRV